MATMHVTLVANDEETLKSFKKDLFLFYIDVVIYMCLRLLCVQNQHRPEEGIRSPGIETTMDISCPIRTRTQLRSSTSRVSALNH